MSRNSASVGFCPRDLITVPNSFVVTVPSPSLSRSGKASLNSAIRSSVGWSAMLQALPTSGTQPHNHSARSLHSDSAAAAKSLQSCPTLCDPTDGSAPGSPVPGILQARILEWVAILLQCMKVKSESERAQLCPTLSDPMDCSLPGFSVHGIFQARELEWGTIAFSTTRTLEPLKLCVQLTLYFCWTMLL